MAEHRFAQSMPVVAMVGLQFIYAGTALSAKAAMKEGLSPMVFVVYRQAIATLALAPPTFFSTSVTTNQFFYYQGLNLASASMASIVSNVTPTITFLMAASAGLEKVDMKSPAGVAKVFGTVICVGGAICMGSFKGPELMTTNSSQTLISVLHVVGKNWKLGFLCLLGSSCSWSIWLILQVPLCKNYIDPLSLSSWVCFLSTLQSAILTYFLEPDSKAWKLNSTSDILCCLYAGVMGSGVTFYVQSWCISRRGPLFSALFNPLYTVIVTILAILLLNEHLYFGSLVGAVAVIMGLYVVLWGKAKDCEDSTRMPLTTDGSSNSSVTNIKEPLLNSKLQRDEKVTV
ncbi:WAT1-related protein At4g30420-like isoform X2 [Asparagus officinalis]|uniref:WAT1-related protein At4g30420-like isoform X2 n=1 Tax=Asparagus officinalis TaxID=4686 RepID=UPI00098E5909|nr:WAT1-related protein At4g30420-like isoform X2 [Asparagus officinalis]